MGFTRNAACYPRRIGIVGLGTISAAYLNTLHDAASITITAVADLDAARSRNAVSKLPGARALTVSELVASDEVDTVLNLTIPAAHAEIALSAIAQGKHVYGEKPFAQSIGEARAMVTAATAAGLSLGCAPDTVLGTGTQTARAAMDSGAIGRPLAASAVMLTPGHERWHPSPDFYYKPGGGPLLDMGPYYVSSLVHLLGPVVSVIGDSSCLRDSRIIGSGPQAGARIAVEVATHVTGVLRHASGVLTTITTSFDAVTTSAEPIAVHGTDASLTVPDPNGFHGDVAVATSPDERCVLAPLAGYRNASRGVGLIEFVQAVGEGREPRANAALALHSLEVMTALLASAESGRRIELSTTTRRPKLVPLSERPGRQ